MRRMVVMLRISVVTRAIERHRCTRLGAEREAVVVQAVRVRLRRIRHIRTVRSRVVVSITHPASPAVSVRSHVSVHLVTDSLLLLLLLVLHHHRRGRQCE